jgi:hypothetical protein
VPVPLEPIATDQVSWDESTRTVTPIESGSYLEFALPETRQVCGIRIRFSHDRNYPLLVIGWKRPDQEHFAQGFDYAETPTGDHANWSRGTWLRIGQPEATATAWVHDQVDRIRIYPHKPCVYRIDGIELLVPSDG